MIFPLILILIILFFLPIKAETVYQSNEHQKRRTQVAEFDLTAEENLSSPKSISSKLETQLGRSYELLGRKISDLGTQLEDNKKNLVQKATDLYKGSIAAKTGSAYRTLQNTSGTMSDGLSSVFHWLGENVIKLGHNTGSMIRVSFHAIGDLFGDTVDKTEHFVGNGLIKTADRIHAAAIDLQHTSHNDSDKLRQRIEHSAPEFSHSVDRIIDNLADKLHIIGNDTESAGQVVEHHQFLDAIKQAYQNQE